MPSKPSPFVRKTFELVSDPLTNKIVSWAPDGLSFTIHNPSMFQSQILPFYFKHNNLCSFVRQLNTYGFRKISTTTLEFRQTSFRRNKPQLLKNLVRKSPKKRSRTEAFCDSSPESDSCQMTDGSNENNFMDTDSMIEAISMIHTRQKENKIEIKKLLAELREAKEHIKQLEALPDPVEVEFPPPLKKVKLEYYPAISDPIDEYWLGVEPVELKHEPDFFSNNFRFTMAQI